MLKIGEQVVGTLVFEDRAYEDGKSIEVALDYFAQDDKGTVFYLGEGAFLTAFANEVSNFLVKSLTDIRSPLFLPTYRNASFPLASIATRAG